MMCMELLGNKKTPVQKPRNFCDPRRASGSTAAGLFFWVMTQFSFCSVLIIRNMAIYSFGDKINANTIIAIIK